MLLIEEEGTTKHPLLSESISSIHMKHFQKCNLSQFNIKDLYNYQNDFFFFT